jgi:hypothetical protein
MMRTSSLAACGDPEIRYFSSSFALFSEPGAPLGQSSIAGWFPASGTISFGGGPGVAGGVGATCARQIATKKQNSALARSPVVKNTLGLPGRVLL